MAPSTELPSRRPKSSGLSVAIVALMLAAGPLLAGVACAATTADGDVEFPKVTNQLGGYLAGRIARGNADSHAAADYLGQALAKDPDNENLASQAFEMEATEGNWVRARDLALQLKALKSDNHIAQLFLGLSEFKSGNFAAADAYLVDASQNPIGELTGLLARAWLRQAQGNTKDALELIDQAKQPDWAQGLVQYHRALIADAGGDRQGAKASFDKLFAGGQRTLRSMMAAAQSAANAGDAKAGLKVLQPYFDRLRGDGQPYVVDLQKRLLAGEATPLLVATASQGISEAMYTLGEALAGEGGVGPGSLFLQFALYLEPRSTFALVALAGVQEGTKHFERAIDTYELIPPGTPLEKMIDIHKAFDLNALERTEEAKLLLEQVSSRHPDDLASLEALGDIMRGQKRWEEAVDYYNRAIATIKKPELKHWKYYYYRGTSFERLKKWPQAETDLQTALKLNPEEPMVLNYLGYSWVDQKRNLKQGLQLIEKAVKLKPDDGYIVDSLGWAHYRLGNYKDAARWLERAVELRPDDPVLNDHYGDSLWRVGREREAQFQWSQALTLKPEPEDAAKIQEKLKSGLPALAKTAPPKPAARITPKAEVQKKRAESTVKPPQSTPTPEIPISR